jgi:formylglycine-generating enzyme required for sulfatase activity
MFVNQKNQAPWAIAEKRHWAVRGRIVQSPKRVTERIGLSEAWAWVAPAGLSRRAVVLLPLLWLLPHLLMADGRPGKLPAAVADSLPPQLVDFVLIKGDSFQLGDVMGDVIIRSGYTTERAHTVTLSDFYLARHELTFDEYDAFCAATGRQQPSDNGWGRWRRPVTNVSWYDAVEYCNWRSQQEGRAPAYTIDKGRKDPNNLSEDRFDPQKWVVDLDTSANGYRLPTEAEWEYAARERGKKVRFGNGRDVIDPADINFYAERTAQTPYSVVGQFRGQTVPVDTLSANALGLKNMSGNVWEWCWDRYGNQFYDATNGVHNPVGPDNGLFRVLRGGAWAVDPAYCRASYRLYSTANYQSRAVGFRLAVSAR